MAGGMEDSDNESPLLPGEGNEVRETWIEIGRLILKALQAWDETGECQRELESCFRDAARMGHAPRCHAFLLMGVDCIGQKRQGLSTALDEAVMNHREAASSLIFKLISTILTPEQLQLACNGPTVETEAERCMTGIERHLFVAAINEDMAYAMAALAGGANPNVSDGAQRTPLMLFAAAGSLGAVMRLLDFKANPSLQDAYCCIARDYAMALGHDGCKEYLNDNQTKGDRASYIPLDMDHFWTRDIKTGSVGAIWRLTQEVPYHTYEDIAKQLNKTMSGGKKTTLLLIATELACRDPASVINPDPKGQVVRALLFWKADPSIADGMGETPLHAAALRYRNDLYAELYTALILLHGELAAEEMVRTSRNFIGRTPLELIAEQEGKLNLMHDEDATSKREVLRFIFAYWGELRSSLQALGWRQLWDMNQGLKTRTVLDLSTPGAKHRKKTKNQGHRGSS